MDFILNHIPPLWLIILIGLIALTLYGIFGKEARLKEYHDDFGNSFGRLNFFNKGHSISEGRTTLKSAFQHTILIGQSGFGKTTAFLLKSVFHFSSERCSIIVLDPAKEIFQNTAGYARQKGKKILQLNFGDSKNSIGYNPLARAWTSTQLATLAELILAPQARNTSDSFWSSASARLLVVIWRLQQCLPREYYNIANTRHFVTWLLSSPKKLDALYIKHADVKLFEDYKALIKQDQKLVSNIVATTLTALRPWEDDEVARVTSIDTLNLDELRSTETALYVHPNLFSTHIAVLYEIFFSQIFEKFLSEIPKESALPIHLVCDELGVFKIKSLETFLATARKFRVSLQYAVQSRQQLIEQYEKNKAASILANTYHKVLFANMEPDLAKEISERLGRWSFEKDEGGKGNREVASVSELIHMNEDKALYLSGSKRPCFVKIKPFYKDWRMVGYSKIPNPELTNILPQKIELYEPQGVKVDGEKV